MRRAWIALALLAAGCLFRNAPGPEFFRPASVWLSGADDAPTAHASGAEPGASAGTSLRLRPVEGTPFLREPIVWRASTVEYGHYESRRWTDLPAHFVQRALEAALAAAPGIALSDDPRAAALSVQVVAFDEVLAPSHAAAVSLAVELVDAGGRRILDRTFRAEAPIADRAPAATAQAMGKALDRAVAEVVAAVGQDLGGG